MSDALSLLPGVVFHARYRVVRCIKRGGMGAVFEVLDERTDSRRALKVMHPDAVEDADLRGRFAQEARVTGAIESDHVVRVSDGGVDEATGTPFLVMELLRGSDLGALLDDAGRLSPRDVVSYLGQAALGLVRAHAAGIVHRDLKPENLFLTRRDDGSPCVKVLDFGIAKIVARRTHARDTRTMGTPTYMAPEQIRGEGTIGPAADVYALGLIAYALLVGQDYWREEASRAGSMFSFFSRVVQGLPEPPAARAARTQGVTLGDAFDAWLLRAAAPRPEDRFDGAGVAVAALAEAPGVEAPPGLTAQPLVASAAGGSGTAAKGVDPLQRETAEPTGRTHDTVPASKWSGTATSALEAPLSEVTTIPVITAGDLPRPATPMEGDPPDALLPAIAEPAPVVGAAPAAPPAAVALEPPARRALPRVVLGSLGAAAVAAAIAWLALGSPRQSSAGTAGEPGAAVVAPTADPPSARPAPGPAPSGDAAPARSPRSDPAKPRPQAGHTANPAKPRASSSSGDLPGLF